MPRERLPKGRTVAPESPRTCPECRDVIGLRGMVRHLRAKHAYPEGRAREVVERMKDSDLEGAADLGALAKRLAELGARLRDLPAGAKAAGLAATHTAALREALDAELAQVREAIERARS
jgi:hypothetical protein